MNFPPKFFYVGRDGHLHLLRHGPSLWGEVKKDSEINSDQVNQL